MQTPDPGHGGGLHLLHCGATRLDALLVGGRFVQAVAGGDDPGAASERRGVIPEIRRWQIAPSEPVEPGEVDAPVVTDETIPREVHVADLGPVTVPSSSGADRKDQIGWVRPARGDRDVGGEGRGAGADAVDFGEGIAAVDREEHFGPCIGARSKGQAARERLGPDGCCDGFGVERGSQRGGLGLHRHDQRHPSHGREAYARFVTMVTHRDVLHVSVVLVGCTTTLPFAMRSPLLSRVRFVASLVLAAAVLSLQIPPANAASGFGDIDEDQFFTDAVAWMVAEGITTGIEQGCFGPELTTTRGQIAAFLYRLDRSSGNDPQPDDHPFADVFADYQQQPVGWLFAAQISTGTSPTTFEPDVPVTRGDFAVLLWRYAGKPYAKPHSFTDVRHGYQQAAVSWMAAEGITTGTTDSTFSPEGLMTRAEAATFIWRYVDPDESPVEVEEIGCTRPLREALDAGGLTSAEAACAAPFLADFEIDYLRDVVADEAKADLGLILAVVQLLEAGCISDARIAQLTRLFL